MIVAPHKMNPVFGFLTLRKDLKTTGKIFVLFTQTIAKLAL